MKNTTELRRIEETVTSREPRSLTLCSKRQRTKTNIPTREKSVYGISRSGTLSKNGHHQLEKLNSSVLIYCYSCQDYSLSSSNFYFQCKKCYMTFHSEECSNFGLLAKCKLTPAPDTTSWKPLERSKNVQDWKEEDVLRWIYCCRLTQLCPFVTANSITGELLFVLSQGYITRFTNVPTMHYLNAFILCIKRLIDRTESKVSLCSSVLSHTNSYANHVKPQLDVKTTPGLLRTQSRNQITGHLFAIKTFYCQVKCDACNCELYGTHQQGLYCNRCGIIVHRFCKQFFHSLCSSTVDRAKSTPSSDIIFYEWPTEQQSLCWIERCFSYLETAKSRYLDVFMTYPSESYHKYTRDALIYDKTGSFFLDLNQSYFSAAAYLIVDYLLELPNLLIPVRTLQEMSSLIDIDDLVGILIEADSLPTFSKEFLAIFSAHINRISEFFSDVGKILKVFSPLIMRPCDRDLRSYPEFLTKVEKILQVLVQTDSEHPSKSDSENEGLWPPPPPPTILDESLSKKSYYWGPISRKEAVDALINKPDGSFLIRESTKNANFVIGIRFQGKIKFIPIEYDIDKCGIIRPFKFDNAAEVVKHYRKNSLKEWLRGFDINLLYPILREESNNQFDKDNLEYAIIEEEKLLQETKKILLQTMEKLEHSSMQLQCEMAIHEIIKQHIDEGKFILMERISATDKEVTTERRELIKTEEALLEEHNKNINQLTALVHNHEASVQDLNREIATLNAAIQNSTRRIYETTKCPSQEIYSVQDYIVENVTRKEVEMMLKEKGNGSFLVRRDETKACFILSVLHDHKFFNIHIKEFNDGFSFNPWGKRFGSVAELVSNYHMNRLPLKGKGVEIYLERLCFKS